MIPGYTTAIEVYQPLMRLLDGVLLTSAEAGTHLRYSPEQMSNLRRTAKGPPFFKLPTGAVRYEASALLAWQLQGLQGALSVERVTLAVSACNAVPPDHRATIIAHLEKAFVPPKGEAFVSKGVRDQIAPALAKVEDAKDELERAHARVVRAETGVAEITARLAPDGKQERGRLLKFR